MHPIATQKTHFSAIGFAEGRSRRKQTLIDLHNNTPQRKHFVKGHNYLSSSKTNASESSSDFVNIGGRHLGTETFALSIRV